MRNILLVRTGTIFMCVAAISLHGAEPVALPTATTNVTSSTVLMADAGASGGWSFDPEEAFRKGAMETGIALGGSVGATIFGGSQQHDLLLSKLYIGRMMTGVMGNDSWYRGNVELMAELFGGGEVSPGNGYVVGVTPVLRYNFVTGTRWDPYLDLGAGVTATDIGHPDLDGTFQFNLQAGAGINWFVRKDIAVTLQCRYLHLSDAGMTKPNLGVNTFAFYAGVSWFF
jgi:lipid A 3-O-deacylase